MKNLAKYLVPVAAAAIALVSCNKEGDITSAPENTVRLTFVAQPEPLKGEEPELKSYIDANNTILWGTGEVMKGCITAGEKNSFATSDEVDASGQTSAAFSFTFTDPGVGPYLYQGLYPASAASTSDNTNPANYKVNLPAIQNATASSYDPAAYIMVAKPESKTVLENWTASYRRGTALNKITLKEFTSSVSVNRVKISAEGKKLAGGRHFNLSTGEGLEVYGTDNAIEVLYATPLSGTSMDVWFTSWGAEIAEGEKLTVVAYTTDSKSYTKEITVPAGKSIKFQEGYLNNTGVSLSGISPEDVTELDPGNYVVLAKDGSNYYALKAEKEDGKERLLSIEYTGDLNSYSGNAALVWTLTKSGNSFVFENDGKYLGYKGSSNESYWLEAGENWTETNYLLDVTAQETAGQYHVTVHSNSARYLSKNSSGAFFAFYGNTGQKADIVFVPATAMEQVAIPTFSPAAGEVTSGTEVTISCATSGATIHYTVDGTDPTSSSATYSSPIEITATTIIKAIAVKSGLADSEIATATYTVPTAGSVTLTDNDITAGDNTVQGTNSNALAYRLGTSNNNGSLTFPAGYSSITFTLAGWASGTRSFSITNGTINGDDSLSPATGSPSGTINAGFSTTYTGTEYTIVVDDPTQEVVFSGRRCVVWGFTAISAGPAVTWNLNSIEITTPPTKTVYTAGQSFDPAGMVVTGHFVDADDNTNTKDEAVTGYTITPDGALATTDTEVTITYQGKTATQNITVNAAPAGNDGSLEHPFTVAEVRAYMDASESNRGPVYITGIVSSVYAAFDQSHGTGIFYISDDGETTSDQFEAYSVKFLGNNAWVNGNTQIAVGNTVIVYGGELTIYNSSVYETKSGSGSYLYSLNGITSETVPTITVSDITGVAAAGVSGATTTVTFANNDGWSASVAGDGTIVTSASISGSTITYSVAANSSDARTGSITVTLTKSGRTDVVATINVGQLAGNGNTTITETITSGTFSGDTSSITMTTSSGITITQLKSDGTNCNISYNTVSTLRVYRANEMQFTGKTFTKIEMYYTGSYSGASWSVVAGGGTVTIDTTNKKVVWTNSSGASTVTLKNSTSSGTNTQLRTTKFYFEY